MDLSDVIGHTNVKEMMPKWLDAPAGAYLFSGPAHVGKSFLAEKFVRLLANHADDKPLQTHPDIIIFLPEEGKKEIAVKSVREARTRLYEKPQIAERMVVYLPKLDWLNQEGFNTLLKVMEEPPAGAVFVSVAEQLQGIPATVMSRMVHIPLNIATQKEVEEGLERLGFSKEEVKKRSTFARGKPGLAISESEAIARYFKTARLFAEAKTLAERLAAIDSLRQSAEAQDDNREGWSNALSACMEVLRERLCSDQLTAMILGQGIIDAYNAIGGPVGPRIVLEGAAIQASLGKLQLPGYMPRAFPLSLTCI